MTTADLNDTKLISEEISIIKDKLAKLANKKEIKHEEISDSEYEYKTDNGTDDEREEENEIIENPKVVEEQEQEQEQEDISEDNSDDDRAEDVKEIRKMLDDEDNIKLFENEYKQKNTSIDLTKYVKREVKQYLNAFDVNISRLIKKYKHVKDISEEELLKIQSKYNKENKFFNKKSKKLLNKLSDYDGLSKDDYKLLNKKIKKINYKFTEFVGEFIDISDSD
tara:strand:- start:1585 stop:2253 length:669 start_codon:yes stop_codon:yes gene_type:complete